MSIPQWIVIVIYALALGTSLGQHGKVEKGTHSFTAAILGTIMAYSILIWGGFFQTVGIPQIIHVVISAVYIGYTLSKNGQSYKRNVSFFTTLLQIVLSVGLLYWGGFFG